MPDDTKNQSSSAPNPDDQKPREGSHAANNPAGEYTDAMLDVIAHSAAP